jgi:hypothetical protein
MKLRLKAWVWVLQGMVGGVAVISTWRWTQMRELEKVKALNQLKVTTRGETKVEEDLSLKPQRLK